MVGVLAGTECWGKPCYVSYPSEFPVGFPVLATWEKNKGLSCISLCLNLNLLVRHIPERHLLTLGFHPLLGPLMSWDGSPDGAGSRHCLYDEAPVYFLFAESVDYITEWNNSRAARNALLKNKKKGKALLVAWRSISRAEGNLLCINSCSGFAFEILIFTTFLLQQVHKTEVVCKICIS